MSQEIALIAHTKCSLGAASANIDTTGANFLVAVSSASAPPSITDSKSNTWHPLTDWITTARYDHQIFYAFNAIVGTGHNFTCNSGNDSLCVGAFSNVKSSADPFHSQNGGSAPAGDDSYACGLVLPPNTSDILLIASGGIDDPAGNTMKCSDGFLPVDVFDVLVGSVYGCSLFYKVLNRGGIAYNPVIQRQTKNTQSGDNFAIAAFLGKGGGSSFLKGRINPQQILA